MDLGLRANLHTGDVAEHKEVREGVAAKAIAAVDAARDFACGVEARNDLAFPVKGYPIAVPKEMPKDKFESKIGE